MKTTTQPTYVLFGKEAIELYKYSIDALVSSNNLKYNVGAYTTIGNFITDKNRWNNFKVISKKEYSKLSKHINENKNSFRFIPFFDTMKKSFAHQLL